MSEKTRFRWYRFLSFILIGILCLIVGGYIGARLAARAIVDNWVNSQTHYTQSHVLVLKQLRDGDIDTAIEQLEAQLDRDIVSLSPDYYDPFKLSDKTRALVDAALGQARAYRQAHPRPKRGRAIERDVDKTLGLGD